MELTTHLQRWTRALSSNSTTSSYESIGVIQGRPVDSADRLVIQRQRNQVNNLLRGILVGTDAANETVLLRVSGAAPLQDKKGTDSVTPLYLLQPLYEITGTLGTATGIDATDFEDENFLCDTIAISATITIGSPESISPADNTSGMFVLDTYGFPDIVLDFKTGTGASVNGFFAQL